MDDLMRRKEQAQMDMLNNKKEISEEGNNSNTKNKILGNIKKKKEDYSVSSPTPNENEKVENEVKTDVISETDEPPTNYKEMLKRFFREKIAGKDLTPEQREKREMRLAMIQDGISAIVNLIATSQGAKNGFTGENTRTQNTRKKWEEFYKKRKEEQRQIYVDQMRALKLEEALRKREKDAEEDEKPTAKTPIQRESEAVKQDQNNSYEAPTTSQIQGESSTDKNGDTPKTVSANTQKEIENNILRGNKVANNSSKKDDSKNNRIGFVDDRGNEIYIHKDVWKGSMQQVFKILVDEGIGRGEHTTPERYKARMSKMNDSQKQDFVKMNWNKSRKAIELMLSYTKKNPPAATSKINNEEIEDYYPGSKEEIIDYVPGKK